MKNIILSLAIIFSGITAIFSQTAPKIPDGWTNFVAEDKSFVVLLPDLSKAKQNEVAKVNNLVKNLLGRNGIYFKQSYMRNVGFGVSFQDFSAPLVDNLDREAQYETIVEEIGVKTGNVFAWGSADLDYLTPRGDIGTMPKDIKRISGIQTVTELDNYYLFSRFFIAEQRLFKLSAIVDKKEIAAHRDDILQFFLSFRIVQIPPAKNAATPLPPKDYKIILNGQQFQSQTLKLNFQFPNNWKIDVFDIEKQKLTPAEQKEYEKQKAALRWIWRNRQGFAWAESTSTKSNMSLIVNRQTHTDIKLDNFVADRAKFWGVKIAETEINGNKFFVLTKKNNEKYYFIKWNEYFLEIFLKYENDSDLKLMEDSLKTLKVSQ